MSRWLRALPTDPLENSGSTIAEVMTDPLELDYTVVERSRHTPAYEDVDGVLLTDPLELGHSNYVANTGTTKRTIAMKSKCDMVEISRDPLEITQSRSKPILGTKYTKDINSTILINDPLQLDDSCSQSRGGNKISDESEVAEIVLSKKGGPKVIHKGFMYTLHKKQMENIRWRCVSRSSHCRGSLTTTIDYKMPQARMEHSHLPDFRAAKIARKRSLLIGKMPILPEENVSFLFRKTLKGNKKEEVSKADDQTDSKIGGRNVERKQTISSSSGVAN